MTLHLLFNHTLTIEQEADAKASFGVDKFVYLPTNLQHIWSNVPSDLEDLKEYLAPIKMYLTSNLKPNDTILIQGDCGATYMMVNLAKSLGAKAVYATTKREVVEELYGDKVIKRSIFKHVRFRSYE